MSRDPKDLTPSLQKKLSLLTDRMKAKGYDIFPTCTYRPNEEQNKLYAIGRTVKIGHPKVTYKQGGKSKHNFKPAQAFDIAISLHGKLIWDANSLPWKTAIEIGNELGLKNLAPFESCHFEEKENVNA